MNHERVTTILGAGSWGTALAIHLARSRRRVVLWAHDPEVASEIGRRGINTKYLPGHEIPRDVRVTSTLAEALEPAGDVLLVVPSHHCRRVIGECLPFVKPSMTF